MTATKCPSFSQLLDLSEGKLAASSRRAVDRHLKGGCKHCSEIMDLISEYSRLMRASHLEDPSQHVVDRALSLFRRKGPGAKNWIRIASSFEPPEEQFHGVRSAESGPHQQSLETSSYKISLMLAYDNAESVLTGQLERKTPDAEVANCLIEILSGKKNMGSTMTNERGEFLFSGLRTKDFELRIHGEPDSVWIVFDTGSD